MLSAPMLMLPVQFSVRVVFALIGEGHVLCPETGDGTDNTIEKSTTKASNVPILLNLPRNFIVYLLSETSFSIKRGIYSAATGKKGVSVHKEKRAGKRS